MMHKGVKLGHVVGHLFGGTTIALEPLRLVPGVAEFETDSVGIM